MRKPGAWQEQGDFKWPLADKEIETKGTLKNQNVSEREKIPEGTLCVVCQDLASGIHYSVREEEAALLIKIIPGSELQWLQDIFPKSTCCEFLFPLQFFLQFIGFSQPPSSIFNTLSSSRVKSLPPSLLLLAFCLIFCIIKISYSLSAFVGLLFRVNGFVLRIATCMPCAMRWISRRSLCPISQR